MIVILKQGYTEEQYAKIEEVITAQGVEIHPCYGTQQTVLGLIGDVGSINENTLANLAGVEKVLRVSSPYKMAGRMFHPDDTVVDVCGTKIGGGHFAVMAGPCSVESEEQVVGIARAVKQSGATILRGGAFKPRTSPYSFQGMGLDGLKLLAKARNATGLPIVTEVMSCDALDTICKYTDIIQVGARNMQNFELLKAVGKVDKPILLKRGLSATIEELLMAAEYIMSEGNEAVILCERGIRTFETQTRNTLDLSAVPVLKRLTHLPVIVDPSHATGSWRLVEPMAKCAAVSGADGMMVEVHNSPETALCDGEESIKPERFDHLMQSVKALLALEEKTLG